MLRWIILVNVFKASLKNSKRNGLQICICLLETSKNQFMLNYLLFISWQLTFFSTSNFIYFTYKNYKKYKYEIIIFGIFNKDITEKNQLKKGIKIIRINSTVDLQILHQYNCQTQLHQYNFHFTKGFQIR